MALKKLKVLPALLLAGAALLSGCSNGSDASPQATENAPKTLEDLVSTSDLKSANDEMDKTCSQFTYPTGEKAYSDCEIFTEDNVLVKEYTYASDPSSTISKESFQQSFETNKDALSQEVLRDVKIFKNAYPELKTMQVAYRYTKPDGSTFIEIMCEEDGTCTFPK